MVNSMIGMGAIRTGYLLRLVVESLGLNVYSINSRPQPEHDDPHDRGTEFRTSLSRRSAHMRA